MTHRIEFADNLVALANLPDASVPLIYIDPPFNTGKRQSRTTLRTAIAADGDRQGFGGRRYRSIVTGTASYQDAYDDYLAFLEPRLREAHRVLAPNGTLYVHLDPREVHYIKVLLDEIFGRASFLNEIIWAYDYGGRPRDRWPAKHDNILVYVKNPNEYVFNTDEIEREPYMAPGLVTPEKAARGKLPTDCYSADTDILTGRGWIPFADLTLDDRVATVAPDGELLYANPTKLHAHHYEGPMVHFKSPTFDTLVTPKHNMYVQRPKQAFFTFMSAIDLARFAGGYYESFLLRERFRWAGESFPTHFELPTVDYILPGHAKKLGPFEIGDWLEFFGYFLAQGGVWISGRKHEVRLTIPNLSGESTTIHSLLERLGIKYHFSAKKKCVKFKNKQLALYLKQFGYSHERFIPREFFLLPPRHLERLYRGLMMGDGYRSGREVRYATTSSKLVADVQELLIKLGSIASIVVRSHPPAGTTHKTGYSISPRRTPAFSIHPSTQASVIEYTGMVYCCTAPPHHTLIVRRNGKPMVCGNCWWHTIVSPTGKEKTGYPTQKPIGVLKRIIAASSRPGDVVLDFFAGSGTTGDAALALGRRFHLIDHNPTALETMARRFASVPNLEWAGWSPSELDEGAPAAGAPSHSRQSTQASPR